MTADPAGVKRAIIQIRYYGIVLGLAAAGGGFAGGAHQWWMAVGLGVWTVGLAWFFAWLVQSHSNLTE